MAEEVLIEVDDRGVATVTLNRPEVNNAYDEAITTPTEDSVRRAVAIQMIINKELGLNFNENPWHAD